MGNLVKKDTSGSKLKNIYSKIIKSILSLIIIILVGYYLKNNITKFHSTLYNHYFDYIINSNKYKLNRIVECSVIKEETLRIAIVFVNPKDFNNSIVKNIDISIINELIIPLALIILLSLIFSTNIKITLLSTFIVYIFLLLKILIIIYDNNDPKFQLIELNLTSGLVYYSNKLIAEIGMQINYLIVIVVWVIANRNMFVLKNNVANK